jgi:hypothetical protein
MVDLGAGLAMNLGAIQEVNCKTRPYRSGKSTENLQEEKIWGFI